MQNYFVENIKCITTVRVFFLILFSMLMPILLRKLQQLKISTKQLCRILEKINKNRHSLDILINYYDLTLQIWNHPDVLYHFLKRRNMGSEVVDLDLEETAGALVPLTPGGNPVAPVLPVKRGRGRSPKGTSPVKRERKVNPRKVRVILQSIM